MTSCVRSISIVTEYPDVLASFYTSHLGLRELGRGAEGDVSLTDGFYNLTFLKQRAGLEADDRLGLNHFGIAIDDIHQGEAPLAAFAANADIQQDDGPLHPGTYRVLEP